MSKPDYQKLARAYLMDHVIDLEPMGLPEDALDLFESAVTELADEFDGALSDRWIEFRDKLMKARAPLSGMAVNAEQGHRPATTADIAKARETWAIAADSAGRPHQR